MDEKYEKNGKNIIQPINGEVLGKANIILKKYKSGKLNLEQKIIKDEEWWRLRHWRYVKAGNPNDREYPSAWLFNVIINKHADGIEAYPEPNILPREESDRTEAKKLTAIIPVILEQNEFEKTYSDVLWQKLKTGTGVYGVFWNSGKLNGLGDIDIRKLDVLNLFWEPGITDIQDSENVFNVQLVNNEKLEDAFPELKGKLRSKNIELAKYLYDDTVDTSDKSVVVDWYYKKTVNGRQILHYCKYVNTTVLYATENDTEKPVAGVNPDGSPVYGASRAERGWYDHGQYPFVFDSLFPCEGTPCGFGYIDVCKSAQEQIDMLNQAIVKNALMASSPRFFLRADGSVNEKEFLDWTKPLIHTDGNLGDDSIRPVQMSMINGNYINILNNKIDELRETSGNTEAATGASVSGVTAASAIAALQEASGKTSRDGTLAAYRAYNSVIRLVIELIRQYYDLPRQYRITGDMGEERFVSYTNAGIKPIQQGYDFGVDMGYKVPVFDIKVSAQKANVYTKMQQNELALQLFNAGVFNPELADQALLLLDTMDFDGKDSVSQKVQKNASLYRMMNMYRELALTMSQRFDPLTFEKIAAMAGLTVTNGGNMGNVEGLNKNPAEEAEITKNARARTAAATQPVT